MPDAIKSSIVQCPKCGGIANFDSYFGAFICDECDWKDDTYNQKRIIEQRCGVGNIDELKRALKIYDGG